MEALNHTKAIEAATNKVCSFQICSFITFNRTDNQTIIQSYNQTIRQSDNQTIRQSDNQTIRQSDSQTVRQSDNQNPAFPGNLSFPFKNQPKST